MKKRFEWEELPKDLEERFLDLSRVCRGDILKMTTLAGSGHPGGSMSSIDIYISLYHLANIDPKNPRMPERDRVVVSHGHTSPGVYSALGRRGFFDIDEAIAFFRVAGSPYEGHIERKVPGIEWTTGNLGQGLSAGCGFALASRLKGIDFHVFVVMGDGEQQKGQIDEARRFAKKYGLSNLTVIVDNNNLQISGKINEIMFIDMEKEFVSDGWKVYTIDGHNFQEIYRALKASFEDDAPSMIIAKTIMGKGISFMEGKREFHGRAPTIEEYKKAMEELGLEDDLERYRKMRERGKSFIEVEAPSEIPEIDASGRITYDETTGDNRSSFGKVLLDIAEKNAEGSYLPMAVFDCDLAESVRTSFFKEKFPNNFFESGIQEHHTATCSGALSTEGILTFFADFGVFGVDETYNQHRLNDINETNLKLVCTHLGVDVGEDGKTHHCTDYIGTFMNLFGYRIILPCDPNQMDAVIRYIAKEKGNFLVGMGRSKVKIIRKEDGSIFYGKDYTFEYGKADLVREGDAGAIISYGSMLWRALDAWDMLAEEGMYLQVWNFPTPKKLDETALRKAASTGLIIVYEDHNVNTGLGTIVSSKLLEMNLCPKVIKMGVTGYAPSGKPGDILKLMGIDEESLVRTVKKAL